MHYTNKQLALQNLKLKFRRLAEADGKKKTDLIILKTTSNCWCDIQRLNKIIETQKIILTEFKENYFLFVSNSKECVKMVQPPIEM